MRFLYELVRFCEIDKFAAGGHAWMVLCNDKEGVVEVKSVTFNE